MVTINIPCYKIFKNVFNGWKETKSQQQHQIFPYLHFWKKIFHTENYSDTFLAYKNKVCFLVGQ